MQLRDEDPVNEEDMRFEFPLELVRKNVLGCLEASKACCTIPGTRHLYHITFVARRAEQIAKLNPNLRTVCVLGFEKIVQRVVSWYLHLQEAGKRQELPTQEADPEDFNAIVVNWADATKALHRHTPPNHSLLRDFSKDSTTDTNTLTRPTLEQIVRENDWEGRRERSNRTYILPELSWMGTLGKAPELYKTSGKVWKETLPTKMDTTPTPLYDSGERLVQDYERDQANRRLAEYRFEHVWPRPNTLGPWRTLHDTTPYEKWVPEVEHFPRIREEFLKMFEKFWREPV